jgi:O-antigen/teichoic acid export membrane protein
MIQKAIQFIEDIVKTNLFRHILTVFVWDNIAKALGIVVTIILIRVLSKEDYALYTFFWASAMFFVGLISNGIDMAYVRFAAEEYSATKRMPHDIYLFSIILCLSIFIVLSPMVLNYREELSLLMFKNSLYDKPLFLGFIAAVGLFLTGMISRYYQVQERYKKAGVFIALEKVMFFLLILLIFFLWELNFLRVVLLRIILLSSLALFFIIMILKDVLSNSELNLNFGRFYAFIRASFWLILYFVTQSFFSYMDIFMISRLTTPEDLANYGVAYKYFSLLLLLYPTLKTVLKVRTSKIDMVESIDKQRQFLKRWLKTSSIFFVPGAVVIVLVADVIMNLLNGPRYAASIMPFKLLVLTAMLYYIFSANIDIFRAKKRYFQLFCFGLGAVIMNFILNLKLIPIYGISGAAFATLLSELIFEGSATIYILYR